MSRRLKRPGDSDWGQFGEPDQIGRTKLVTPERRRRPLAEAREGERFLLGLPCTIPRSQVFPGRHRPSWSLA